MFKEELKQINGSIIFEKTMTLWNNETWLIFIN